ncbi:type IV toxin-antitoxin system AbiEi family antitoxin domain-containing protein [Candidatus Poriferisocius sp.]|uniref:type IV toxin-antitoxin system AbiEi family antitoxin domain-containing protein n=1 Tax=Candidatus Poriferisocius sp. TaxID=3101276 RepID=UPI003B02E3E7
MAQNSLLGRPSTSPFSPHFGRTPHSLVGRDSLLAEVGGGLLTGPNDPRYTSIFMGVRGSGKTVALNEVEDRAAGEGWVVLSMDAGTPGLLERITQAISQADRTYEALNLAEITDRRSIEKGIGIRLGPLEGKMATTEHRDHGATMGLREHLTYLVQAAQRHGASVLLTIDELQGIDRVEGRRLSNDLQHITRRAELPLAFLGAGLLELKHTLLGDRKMTFFHRCEHFDMPPLATEDAAIGLAGPIQSSGGTITGTALALGSKAVNGSPYRLQVIGDIAWKTSGAPDSAIDTPDIEAAIAVAAEVVDAKISVAAWHDLSEGSQRLLEAIGTRGGTTTSAQAAQDSGIDGKTANDALRRLADTGYLERPGHGTYRLTDLVPREIIRRETEPPQTTPPIPAALLKCRKWMPRAKAYCVLSKNHTGGCRSK